uniref:Integral membrane family protein n=1 Tax=Solanum tuberosum TaxID=4113 RepID=M1AAC0_SOLTU
MTHNSKSKDLMCKLPQQRTLVPVPVTHGLLTTPRLPESYVRSSKTSLKMAFSTLSMPRLPLLLHFQRPKLSFLTSNLQTPFDQFPHLSTLNPRHHQRSSMKVQASVSDLGIVERAIQLVQSSPPTWQSALLSNIIIFTLGSPLLVSGLSLSGIGAAFLLGTLTWRAFGSSGFLLVATYFVISGKGFGREGVVEEKYTTSVRNEILGLLIIYIALAGVLPLELACGDELDPRSICECGISAVKAVTKVKMAQKEAQGVAEKRKGRRGPGSVIGSSAAGCVCAFLSINGVGGEAFTRLWELAFVASFCTKLSDTVSSEIGKAYGKTTYLVTTFKVVPRGTEGAVSAEGTLAGLLASVLLAFVGYLKGQINIPGAAICVIAAQIANFGESLIGASFQEKEGFRWLNNDVVNVINISLGSILAVLMQKIILQS